MVSTIPLIQALMLCNLAISTFPSIKALPSHHDGQLIKRDSSSQCGSGEMSLKNDDKAFKLNRVGFTEDVFSSFKGGNVDVTFASSNGGGIRDRQYMEIINKSSTDFLIFVKAYKIVSKAEAGKFGTTSKAFQVKAMSTCTADVLSGATVSSVYEVDAQTD